MRKLRNITGEKYGRLTAIKFIEIKNHLTYWLFKCECGKEKIIMATNVIYKHSRTISCGCWSREYAKGLAKKYTIIHGMCYTRFYKIWRNILQRCNNPKHRSYPLYGARGIKCLWKNFIEFRNDMHFEYFEHVKDFGEKNTSIDRINNEGHYCRENTRWATQKEQMRNTRFNRLITFKGKTLCLKDWANETKIHYDTLRFRINKNWSIEKALLTPIRYKKYNYDSNLHSKAAS